MRKAFAVVCTVLFLAASCAPANLPPIHDAVKKGDLEAVRTILKGDPSALTAVDPTEGWLPIHSAAYAKHTDIAELLISLGADVNARTESYSLSNGAGMPPGTYTMSSRLVTPLHLAYTPEMAKLLLAHGADPNLRDAFGTTPLLGAMSEETALVLLSAGAASHVRDYLFETPLHKAAAQGWTDAIRALAAGGAFIEARAVGSRNNGGRNEGRTALHYAVEHGMLSTVTPLLDAGANVNATDDAGDTPLHLAAEHMWGDMVELLISRGADIDARNHRTATPLDTAFYKYNRYPLEVLLYHGAERPVLHECNAVTRYDCTSVPGKTVRALVSGEWPVKPPLRVTRHLTIREPDLPTRDYTVSRGAEKSHDRSEMAVTPCWSPDGRMIATRLSVWKVDDRGAERLMELENGVRPIGFSRDGELLAYLRSDRTEPAAKVAGHDLCTISLRDKKPKLVARDIVAAEWSPVGEYFAAIRRVSGQDGGAGYSLCMIRSDGGDEKRLVEDIRPGLDRFGDKPLAWSPDGGQIAFANGDCLWVVNADGSAARRLTDALHCLKTPDEISKLPDDELKRWGSNTVAPRSITWSADGRSAMFLGVLLMEDKTTRDSAGLPLTRIQRLAYNLYSVQPATGEIALVIPVEDRWEGLSRIAGVSAEAVAWSPDRSRMAILSDNMLLWARTFDDGAIFHHTGVWTMYADGMGLSQAADLTCPVKAWQGEIPTTEHIQPSWSPDGTKIAVMMEHIPEQLHVLTVK